MKRIFGSTLTLVFVSSVAMAALGSVGLLLTFNGTSDPVNLMDGAGADNLMTQNVGYYTLEDANGNNIPETWVTPPGTWDIAPEDFTFETRIYNDMGALWGEPYGAWGGFGVGLTTDTATYPSNVIIYMINGTTANNISGYDGSGGATGFGDGSEVGVANVGAVAAGGMLLRVQRVGNTLTYDFDMSGTGTYTNLFTLNLTAHPTLGDVSGNNTGLLMWFWGTPGMAPGFITSIDFPNRAVSPATPANYVTSRDDDVAEPFTSLSANWTITFDEPVTGVSAGDATLTTNGDAVAAAPTLSVVGNAYTFTSVVTAGSSNGGIVFDFVLSNVITTAGGVALTGTANFPSYSISSDRPSVPASTNWTLLLTGGALVLCAGLFFGRKAIRS